MEDGIKGWQVCPLCQGRGLIAGAGNSTTEGCPTCNGQRIISILDGKPPIR